MQKKENKLNDNVRSCEKGKISSTIRKKSLTSTIVGIMKVNCSEKTERRKPRINGTFNQ